MSEVLYINMDKKQQRKLLTSIPTTSCGDDIVDEDGELLLLRGLLLSSVAVVHSPSFFFDGVAVFSIPSDSECKPQVKTLPSSVMATL